MSEIGGHMKELRDESRDTRRQMDVQMNGRTIVGHTAEISAVRCPRPWLVTNGTVCLPIRGIVHTSSVVAHLFITVFCANATIYPE